MKKNTLAKLSVLLFVAISLASCAAQTSTFSTYKENNARKVEGSTNQFVVTPLAADLEVISQERITYVATYDWNKNYSLDFYKNQAIVDATVKYSADAIVASLIQIETPSQGSQIKLTLTGYPAVYKNFRVGTEADVNVINAAKEKPVVVPAPASGLSKLLK